MARCWAPENGENVLILTIFNRIEDAPIEYAQINHRDFLKSENVRTLNRKKRSKTPKRIQSTVNVMFAMDLNFTPFKWN